MSSNVSWGKILVGAAVAAGAVAVIAFAPGVTAAVGSAITGGASAIFGGLGSVGAWIASQTALLAGFVQGNPTAAIGAAAAAGGLAASAMGSHHGRERDLEEESFAMREDMRRMQALMAARMAATGYQPAMAMARTR